MKIDKIELAKGFLCTLEQKLRNAKFSGEIEDDWYIPHEEIHTAIECIDKVQKLEKENAMLKYLLNATLDLESTERRTDE